MILTLRVAFVVLAGLWLLPTLQRLMFADSYRPAFAPWELAVLWGRLLALTASIVFVAIPLAQHTD